MMNKTLGLVISGLLAASSSSASAAQELNCSLSFGTAQERIEKKDRSVAVTDGSASMRLALENGVSLIVGVENEVITASLGTQAGQVLAQGQNSVLVNYFDKATSLFSVAQCELLK